MSAIRALTMIAWLAMPAEKPPPEGLRFAKIPDASLVRGSRITYPLSGIADGDKDVTIRLIGPVSDPAATPGKPGGPTASGRLVPASFTADRSGCTFAVPLDLRLGDYYVGVSRSEKEPPTDRVEVKVIRAIDAPLKVSAVEPNTGFPKEKGAYNLTLLGEGFSEVPEDNVLVFDGRDELDADWTDQPAPKGKIRGIFHGTHKIEFRDIPDSYWGAVRVRVRVGDKVSDPPILVTLSGYGSKTPLFASLGVTGGLAALIYFLGSRGLTRATIAGQPKSVLTTFLLDPETDSFSLSKFQLYAWTAVSVFGYLYLLLVRSLIQGHFEFAPVPENLPSLLLLSGSTTAVAKGISTARGPKGAGEVQPSLSDFITAGGVVSAERFQFFVWTILGVIAFPFLIAAQSPAQFQEIPKIPDGLLYLMGASSAGYLGGKLARKPGPVIDSIVAQQGSLMLEVFGRCLSRDAAFMIEDSPVTVRLVGEGVEDASTATRAPATDATLVVIRKDEGAPDPSVYASELRLTLADPTAWLSGHRSDAKLMKSLGPALKFPLRAALPAAPLPVNNPSPPGGAPKPPEPIKCRFTITNPDGQAAVWFFEVAAPTA